ncbi:MAG TPA: hypothetical protein VK874_14935 [Gaiellaceae bacterium]|nr:hypothetical protein [Gaiellaceae bacterium]
MAEPSQRADAAGMKPPRVRACGLPHLPEPVIGRAQWGRAVRCGLPQPWRASSSRGGGGGIWGWGGWGGIAYGAVRDSLYVVTGNAFEGGENVGDRFSETAGHGEQLVRPTRDLEVVEANHPQGFEPIFDADFVGSPVLFTPSGCGELVAALNKNGTLYVWRSDAVAAGTVACVAGGRAHELGRRPPRLAEPRDRRGRGRTAAARGAASTPPPRSGSSARPRRPA